jgi:8-oxo-dGTP diphosphatase
MSDLNIYPRVGIALIMTYEGRLLIGRRNNQPMPQSWQLPGGWLLYNEAPMQAVQRLRHHFHGLECTPAEFVSYTNNIFDNGQHSVSLYFQMQCLNVAEIDLQRNQDCSDWMWADWYDLPQPLFLPLMRLKQSNYQPFIRD